MFGGARVVHQRGTDDSPDLRRLRSEAGRRVLLFLPCLRVSCSLVLCVAKPTLEVVGVFRTEDERGQNLACEDTAPQASCGRLWCVCQMSGIVYWGLLIRTVVARRSIL